MAVDALPQVVIVIIVILNYSIKCFSKNRIIIPQCHNVAEMRNISAPLLHAYDRPDKQQIEREGKPQVSRGQKGRRRRTETFQFLRRAGGAWRSAGGSRATRSRPAAPVLSPSRERRAARRPRPNATTACHSSAAWSGGARLISRPK